VPDAASDAGPALAPGEPPPLPPTATGLATKAKDLQALRDAVVDAASVGAGLWFSYLFVLFYLLVAVGGVTHGDLFLQSPVKLPFLNLDLPLLGFFVLGPAIFLIVHAYVLLHFVLLAGKVGDFDAELKEQTSTRRCEGVCAASCRAIFSCSSWPDRATCAPASWASCCGSSRRSASC
jgi:hypothetical protein